MDQIEIVPKLLDRHKEDRNTRFVELGHFVGDELNVEDFLEGGCHENDR